MVKINLTFLQCTISSFSDPMIKPSPDSPFDIINFILLPDETYTLGELYHDIGQNDDNTAKIWVESMLRRRKGVPACVPCNVTIPELSCCLQ